MATGAVDAHALERLSVFVLVSSALVQLTSGFLNALNWYSLPGRSPRPTATWCLIIGSILLHIGIKLPDIEYGLHAKLAEADVLTEIPWRENPLAHSNAGTVAPPETPPMDRRGLLVTVGAGIVAIVLTTVGQTVTPPAPRADGDQTGLDRPPGGAVQDRTVGSSAHAGQVPRLASGGGRPEAVEPDPG